MGYETKLIELDFLGGDHISDCAIAMVNKSNKEKCDVSTSFNGIKITRVYAKKTNNIEIVEEYDRIIKIQNEEGKKKMECARCTSTLIKSDKYCSQCGTKVPNDKEIKMNALTDLGNKVHVEDPGMSWNQYIYKYWKDLLDIMEPNSPELSTLSKEEYAELLDYKKVATSVHAIVDCKKCKRKTTKGVQCMHCHEEQ